MKTVFRRILCVALSLILVLGSGIAAFAVAPSAADPVIVINDLDANPICNTEDRSVVFDFRDYQYDILFTTGFSSNFTELFSKDVLDAIAAGEMSTTEIITMLSDYLGFSGDINTLMMKALELASNIMTNVDLSELDVQSIMESLDLEQYAADLQAKIEAEAETFGLLAMKEDGTPLYDNIGVLSYPESLAYYYEEDSAAADALAGNIGVIMGEKIGYESTYVFTYDWRLDPMENAEKLDAYIENVKSATGAEKVSVISEGYGATVATAYLDAFADAAAKNVKNFVTVSSEFLGTSLVGDFMKGAVVNEYSNLTTYTSAYIRYMNDISDNPLTAFSTWLVNYILNNEWDLQAFCLEVEKVLARLNYVMDKAGITAEIAQMPGVWALVPVSDFDAAADRFFGEEKQGTLYDTISSLKDSQANYQEILVNAKSAGINVSIVAAWDLQLVPIGENCSVQSDGVVDTAYASFGATCVPLNNVTEAMNARQTGDLGHDHMSANYDMLTPWYSYGGICYYIDASTCTLPENTWFIKNMKHGTFSSESNSADFLVWLIRADSERTVWENVAYKQFMNYNRYLNPGKLNSDGIVPSEDWDVPGKYLMGDINLDGLVTAIDARLALRSAAGLEPIEEGTLPFKNGDVYPDNIINAADARKILLMSSGLIEDMQSGVKFEFDTEKGTMTESAYKIELRPSYNPVRNQFAVQLVLLDAEGSYSGNFSMKYDGEIFTYVDADEKELANGYVVAGDPVDNIVTCSYAVSAAIEKEDCDENRDLLLTTFYFDVSRKNLKDTVVSAGAAYFYENGSQTFIEPVSLDLDEKFFLLLGDADNNGYINAADARIILRIAAMLEHVTDEDMFARCDVDCDGKITAVDARLVLRATAKLIDSYEDDIQSGNNIDATIPVEEPSSSAA